MEFKSQQVKSDKALQTQIDVYANSWYCLFFGSDGPANYTFKNNFIRTRGSFFAQNLRTIPASAEEQPTYKLHSTPYLHNLVLCILLSKITVLVKMHLAEINLSDLKKGPSH